jgi:hypothetical protein
MTHYVSPTGANVFPYTNWANAARDIQTAVDSAFNGDDVLVTNGTYSTGGRPLTTGGQTNRVSIEKPLNLRSVNGPQFTTIKGYQVPTTTNSAYAVRCVYLADGATLSGFTLTGGATGSSSDGGGLYCNGSASMVSNCIITANSADRDGAGAYVAGTLLNCTLSHNTAFSSGGGAALAGGSLTNCTLTGNSAAAAGGGASRSGGLPGYLVNCTVQNNASSGGDGGGAAGCRLIGCQVTSNAAFHGGGCNFCYLTNCLLSFNSATDSGGGAIFGALVNCVISYNSAGRSLAYSGDGGGAEGATLIRCIITSNTANTGGGVGASMLHNCLVCRNQALPVPGSSTSLGYGGGAFSSHFVNCTITLNSSQGIYGGTASCGLTNSILYFNSQAQGPEFQPSDTFDYCLTSTPVAGAGNIVGNPLFIDIASDYHLSPQSPCINSGMNSALNDADTFDLDGHARVVDFTVDLGAYEFRPPLLNSFRILSCNPSAGTTTLTWESVAGAIYSLEQATDLSSPSVFTVVATNIPGNAATTTFTSSNTPAASARFYRVGVQ